MTTIAVIAMGEMGSGIAKRLSERGARIITFLAGRSELSVERARKAGAEPVTYDTLVGTADIFLSIVPPASAKEVAARFLDAAKGKPQGPVYIDCNAIAPSTLLDIGQSFSEAGLAFGDGSIIGSAPVGDKTGPRVYLSGPIKPFEDVLRRYGLDARWLSPQLGDASALKMSYSGIGKGFQALGTAMAIGADRAGVLRHLIDELNISEPQFYAWFQKMLPAMQAKAYRWDGEMLEISKFLELEPGSAEIFQGAASLYRHVAEDHRTGPTSEIVSILQRFVGDRTIG